MDPLLLGLVVGVSTVVMLFSGIPIAFGLCFISVVFLVIAEGFSILNVFAETFYAGLNSFVLLSIPMFILMGMAVANSPAGKDLYTGLDRWLWRLPGGLVVSNIGACSIFAALSGSSPATCAAIGTMGIPEMRKRGYSARLATGCIAAGGTLGVLIPPSIVLIVYGLATGTSIGRLFLCGVIPGLLLAGLFMLWAYIYSYFIDKKSAEILRNRKPPTLREKYGFTDEEVEFFDLHIVSDEIHGERGYQIVLEHANTIELQQKCLKICEIGAQMRLSYTTALFNDYVKGDLTLKDIGMAA